MSKPMSPFDRAGAPRRRPTTRIGLAAAAVLLAALPVTGLRATDLSNVPLPTYTVGSTTDIKPNIMMVLDDSGSMDWDYLPDWANDRPGNYSSIGSGDFVDSWGWGSVHVPNMPQYLYFNSGFNGVAYNPAITYSPPMLFNSDGTKDTTTYPSMTGTSAATGRNTSLAANPNWGRVPNDGYGIQRTDTSDLMNSQNAYFYTLLAGEYCDSSALTNCQTTSTGKFLYPAPLRWCSDQQLTKCRGLQSGTYKYPRAAAPRVATLSISSFSNTTKSLDGITVDSKQIMSGATSANSSSGLASNIVSKINACTYALSGSCQVVGYFATVSDSSSREVIIFAPGLPTNTPAVATSSTASTTITSFDRAPIPIGPYFNAGGNWSSNSRSSSAVPGENLRTVLTSSIDSYAYPGKAEKAATRTDCAGTTCTYAEEMTNYANWWAYYRTRMQMMKTATSRAFGVLDSDDDNANDRSRFRVGYLTINGNATNDFVNINEFKPSQKVIWYSQLFKAKPNQNTPLRSALATAGQLYGGVMNGKSYRGSTVTDPLQYSCQKNYTLLSTDGYWNENENAPNSGLGSKLDGKTMVGNQDGGLSRPYNDGATQQLQQSTSKLQTRLETQKAEKGTLQKQVTQIQMQTAQLQTQTYQLTQTTTQPTQVTYQLQKQVTQVQQQTSTLQRTDYQLERSTNGGASWFDVNSGSCNTSTGLCRYRVSVATRDVSSCSPVAQSSGGGNWNVRQAVTCSYNDGPWTTIPVGSTCTIRNKDMSGTWSVATATDCQYDAPNAPTDVTSGSCTQVAKDTGGSNGTQYNAATSCNYVQKTTAQVASCTIKSPSTGSPYSVLNPVSCSYGSPTSGPTNVASCSRVNQATGTGNNTTYPTAVSCDYAVATPWASAASCTKVAGSTGPNYTVQNPVDCQYSAYGSWTNAPSCTTVPESTGTNYTVQNPVKCTTTVTQAYAPAASCTPTTVADAGGQTFQCKYVFASSAATQTCLPAYAAGDYSNATVYQNCTTSSTAAWTDTNSCTITSPDASGQFRNCQYGSWSTFSNVGSCTETPQSAGPTNFTVGTAVTCQTVAGSGGTTDSLADVAAYYYNKDLRDASATGADKTGTCTAASGNDLCTNNVTAYGRDVSPKQHMTTHTLGLGAQGYMVFSPYQNDVSGTRAYYPDYWTQPSGDFYDVASASTASPSTGICPWLSNGDLCTWPSPKNDSPANIDDLWHAAVNGHGSYFSATNPVSLAEALTSVLTQITNTPRPGTAAAAASSNPNITSSDNYVFSSSYRSVDWYGELIMQRFNLDGSLTPQQWSAMRLLDCAMTGWVSGRKYLVGDVYQQGGECYLVTKEYTAGGSFSTGTDGNNTAKLTSGPVTRKIYTEVAGTLKDFTNDNLDGTQQGYFSKAYLSGSLSQFCTTGAAICLSDAQQTAVSGDPLINYLKGDRTNEGTIFRARSHILGDIVSSEARYVKVPLQNYADSGYSAFKTKMNDRAPTVYVGANDGMLHAFDALTGQERWGFVPSAVLPNLHKLADLSYNNNHRYFVDGTPEVGDICPKAPSGTCSKDEWKTVLVGGLNQGGKSFYALDVTDPADPKFLWQFTDTNLGYAYSNPRMGKLKDGTWAVMVASGYNNADGLGHLYVINANTGALIRDIVTSAGSSGNPSGLARLAARAPSAGTNNTVEEVYGGDLLGNVWRFDVNDNIGASGYDAQLLVSLKDPDGNPQPVTAKPTVASTPNNLPLVIVGTGRYLGADDLKDLNVHSVYAIKDKLDSNTLPTPRSSDTWVQQTLTIGDCPDGAPSTTCTQGQQVRLASANTVDWTAKNGWYLDFPVGGERSVTDATLALGTLVFTTIKPQSATADQIAGCTGSDTAINAKSYLYYLDYLTGGAVDGTKNVVGEELCTCIATRPSVVKTQTGNVEGIIRTSGGASSPTSGGETGGVVGGGPDGGGSTDMGATQRQDLPYKNAGGAARRISYRELNGE